MSETASTLDVLSRFRRDLTAAYGKRLERVVMFGSRARGNAYRDSDYDVAVFIHEPAELWDELGRLSHITTQILDDTGAVISASPFPAGAYRERSPLMQEIRRDGIDLLTPEAERFLGEARQCLVDAQTYRPLVPRIAAREAYLAAFHAAHALVHDRTGAVAKTHRGVRSQYALLTKDDPRVDPRLREFLGQAYDLKSRSDYGTGAEAYISPETAEAAIQGADNFVGQLAAMMT